FYLNVPLGVLGLLAAHRVLPASSPRTRAPLDVPGPACLGIGLALLTTALSFGEEWGWMSPRLLTCLAAAAVALAGGGVIERHVAHPTLDLALLRDRVLASSLSSLTLAMLALFGVSFMLP